MPYKSKRDRLRAMKKWRKKHPNYMRDYGRQYYALNGKKALAVSTSIKRAEEKSKP